jgi:hypothetical protein
MSGTRKKPSRRRSLSNILSRFSRKKIVPVVNNRENEYIKRSKLTIKYKPESRSPEPTSARFLNTLGNYVSSDLDSIVPSATSVNTKYNINDYLLEADILVNNAEYVRPPTMIEQMRTLIGRPKTHPQEPRMYVFVNPRKNGGKTRRKKNPRKRGRGGTCSSRQ